MRHVIRTADQADQLAREVKDKLRTIEAIEVSVQPFKPPKTRDQEDKFHAMLRDVVKSGIEWGGRKRTFEEWKILVKSAIQYAEGNPVDIVRGIEGEVVYMPSSCATWKRQDYSNAIEYLYAFGAEHDVHFTEQD
jgi:hypothetical protein